MTCKWILLILENGVPPSLLDLSGLGCERFFCTQGSVPDIRENTYLRLQCSFFSHCSLPLSSLYKRCNLARVFSKDRAAMKRTAIMHAATVAQAWKAFESITRTWTFFLIVWAACELQKAGKMKLICLMNKINVRVSLTRVVVVMRREKLPRNTRYPWSELLPVRLSRGGRTDEVGWGVGMEKVRNGYFAVFNRTFQIVWKEICFRSLFFSKTTGKLMTVIMNQRYVSALVFALPPLSPYP